MTVLIFGGTGFIGRHLCVAMQRANLTANVVSRNPDNVFLSTYAPKIKAYQVDNLTSSELIKSASSIVYLAHNSRPGTTESTLHLELNANLSPVVELLAEISNSNPNARLIYISSGGQVYGAGHNRPLKETDILRPSTVYGLGKSLIEQAIQYYITSHNLNAAILRVGNPVGLWQLTGKHGFVSACLRAAIFDKPLNLYGKGTNVRDYFDVNDLAQLVVNLCQTEWNSGVYNIGSGIGHTEIEVMDIVSHITGREIQWTEQPPRPFDIPYANLDIHAAQSQLAWDPITDLYQVTDAVFRQAQQHNILAT